VRHLAYLGDAEVGERVTVGATAVTANFDGQRKNPTRIGSGSLVGAGAVLVAPVTVGRDAVVGANCVVTRRHDVADGQTVVGVPARPIEPDRPRTARPVRAEHDDAMA
jgi:bifunctional UDP-N-acetylglucosamine pyrophosphorylase / glucosamine-1-phosphate N-acetyltransferase